MADLAATAVTMNAAWSEGNPNGKRFRCKQVTLALTGQGSTTNKITAAVLGLTKIEQSGYFVASDNSKVLPTSPNYDGTLLLFASPGDGAADGPVDITGTYRGVVKGY